MRKDGAIGIGGCMRLAVGIVSVLVAMSAIGQTGSGTPQLAGINPN